MKKYILIGFVAVFALMVFGLGSIASYGIAVNNSLVNKEETVNSAYAQVQNVYQRRLDLIPNLVETVKGYATHEKDTLTQVAQARNQAAKIQLPANPTTEQLAQYQNVQQGLGNALGRLMVISEKYPELKADEGFLRLQSELEGTENRIAVERKKFNDVTKDFNTSIKIFPDSFIATFRNMTAKPYFEADKEAKTAPKVKF